MIPKDLNINPETLALNYDRDRNPPEPQTQYSFIAKDEGLEIYDLVKFRDKEGNEYIKRILHIKDLYNGNCKYICANLDRPLFKSEYTEISEHSTFEVDTTQETSDLFKNHDLTELRRKITKIREENERLFKSADKYTNWAIFIGIFNIALFIAFFFLFIL